MLEMLGHHRANRTFCVKRSTLDPISQQRTHTEHMRGDAQYTGAIPRRREPRRPPFSPKHFGSQEVFHLFVFAAAICHYIAVWKVVTPTVVA